MTEDCTDFTDLANFTVPISSTTEYDEAVTRHAGEIVAAEFATLRPTPWLLSNHEPSTHPDVLRDYFPLQVERVLHGGYGHVEMIDGKAVAVWEHSDPASPPRPLPDYEERLKQACRGRPENFVALENAFAEHHPSWPVEHLVFLAVRSDVRRTRLGTALLLNGLSRLDKLRREGFLEATTAANVGFYERRGFRSFPPLDGPVHPLQPYLMPDKSTLSTPMIRRLVPA